MKTHKQENFLFTKDKYNKVCEYLSKNILNESNIQKLLSQCEKYGDICLIGGAIKDIAFFNRTPKDFDFIVISTDNIKLELPKCFKININSFGSYKITYKNYTFDIWNCENERDILNNSIKFNADGLYINLSKKYYKSELFNQAIREGVLRIVNNKKHPNYEKDFLRGKKLSDDFNLKYEV